MNARNGHSPEQHVILEAELDSTVLEEQLYSSNIYVYGSQEHYEAKEDDEALKVSYIADFANVPLIIKNLLQDPELDLR